MANAQRNAWRTFKKHSIGWKIPLSEFVYDTGEGERLCIPFISPKAYFSFLLNNCADLLVGGCMSMEERCIQLQSFWAAYKQQHSNHAVYHCFDSADLAYTVPFLLHGDEGRGKRRTGTMVVMLEAVMGLPSPSKKRKHCGCNPPPAQKHKYKRDVASLGPGSFQMAVRKMVTNTKHHSFLQRFPLIVIPGVVYKAYPGIVEAFHQMLGLQLRDLFYAGVSGPGGRVYTGALIGLKADMKWHTRIGCLSRSYEHQGRIQDLPCCRFCMGGSPGKAWEDVSENPSWLDTTFTTRPWTVDPPLLPVPFDSQAPEAFYRIDPFHTGKVGILRDMVGSSIFWMIRHDYYGARGDIPSKLASAFGAFKLFCSAQSCTAALRSFTKMLFSYKTAKSFPWTNTKGSDTVLLLRFVVLQAAAFINDPLRQADLVTLREIHQTASNGLAFYDALYNHGLFLDRDCALSVYVAGNKFIAGYCRLAHSCLHRPDPLNLFGIKPKLHMMRHMLLQIQGPLLDGAETVISPLAWNTEQNEDCIGRLSRLSRRLDSRNLCSKILMCYLVKAQCLYNRLKKSRR
eukprot:Skav204910  [mRNA]  locus=scaffold2145:72845:74551:- [translate_table: standard]